MSAAAAPTIGAATIGVARDVAVPAAPLDESSPISLLSGPIKERKIYAEMQDLYAVMVATEHLEGAFARALITDDKYKKSYVEYQRAYDTLVKSLQDLGAITNIYNVVNEYALQLPKAINRLELVRIPATDQHFSATSVAAEPMLCVETTGVLITTVDMVKLNQVEVDQLAPCVSACLESLNKHTWLKDFDPKTKLQEWKRVFDGMKASDALNEAQARQLAYDLGQALDGFRDRLDKLIGKRAE